MSAITLLRPQSVQEACRLLADHGSDALPCGGGTAIQILRKQGLLASPLVLVDLSGLAELRDLADDGSELTLGATVTHAEVEDSPLSRRHTPLLAETCGHVANRRVRNTSTVGGNIAHGDYRLDPPAALLVLGAAVDTASPGGSRSIPIGEFFVDFEITALEPAELVTRIRVPHQPSRSTGRYLKFSSLGANDWPCAGVAVLLVEQGERRLLRVGVTALAAVPQLCELEVSGMSAEGAAEAATAAVDEVIDPIPDFRGNVTYKRRIARAVVADAVLDVHRRHLGKEAS